MGTNTMNKEVLQKAQAKAFVVFPKTEAVVVFHEIFKLSQFAYITKRILDFGILSFHSNEKGESMYKT